MLDDEVIATQRRGRRAAMTAAELDDFLASERMCRLASIRSDGTPHASALWFIWDGRAMWFYSIVKSQRWADITSRPEVAVVVDAGHDFGELRGVELRGELEQVGEIPRTGALELPNLLAAERAWAAKYRSTGGFQYDGRHAWLRLAPARVASWDFRKTVR